MIQGSKVFGNHLQGSLPMRGEPLGYPESLGKMSSIKKWR
jgi:hypothetical protein